MLYIYLFILLAKLLFEIIGVLFVYKNAYEIIFFTNFLTLRIFIIYSYEIIELN